MLITAKVTRSGSCIVEEGIQVEMPVEGQAPPFAHVLVGRPNTGKKFHRIPVGKDFLAELPKYEIPCPRQDKTATLGRCRRCGLDITHKMIRKQVVGTLEGGLNLYDFRAQHNSIQVVQPVRKGVFILTKAKNTLMFVQADPHRQNDGRMAVLLSADAGYKGTSTIHVGDVDPITDEIHAKGQGYRWAPARDGSLGKSHERLLILKPGMWITVYRTGNLEGGPAEVTLTVDARFQLHVVDTNVKDEETAVKERKQVTQEVIEKVIPQPENEREAQAKHARQAMADEGETTAPPTEDVIERTRREQIEEAVARQEDVEDETADVEDADSGEESDTDETVESEETVESDS